MKFFALLVTFIFLSVVSSVPLTHAETISFDNEDLEGSGAFILSGDGAYQISDFNGLFPNNVLGWCAQACEGLQTIILKRAGGAEFSFDSVDAAALWNAGDNNPVVITGTLVGGGVVTQNLVLPNAVNVLKTFAITGFSDVTEVRFSKLDTSSFSDFNDFDAAIDNLVVSAPDIDDDGVANSVDDCPLTEANAQVNAAGCADADGDGVADTDDAFPNDPGESADADDDGVGDGADQCPSTPANTQVNAAGCADADGDGVADTDDAFPNDPFDNTGADGDIDGDGVANGIDDCPGTAANTQVNATGCADADGDGVADTDDAFPNDPSQSADADDDDVGDGADQCPSTPINTQVNAAGCADADGDGVADTDDAFPNDPGESADADDDGVGDSADQCPSTPANTQVNAAGCADADGDGVADTDDAFPNDPFDNTGADGDIDGDGVANGIDDCPGTAANTQVNATGCADADGDGVADTDDAFPNDPFDNTGADGDIDGDGVANGIDDCPGTAANTQVNATGCADADGDGVADTDDAFPNDPFDNTGADGDIDGDGVANGIDDCPGTAANTQVNATGCADADGDGVADTDDAFPNDPSENADADDDGVGDLGDYRPGTVGSTQVNAQGCADADGDGVADTDDAFPNDPFDNTGADGDIDGDGAANGIDDCPGTAANTQVNATGCADADGDGVADTDDAFPNDPSESADADDDGVGDGADQCPSTPANTQVNAEGCSDADGDGVADTDDAFPNDPFDNTGADDDIDGDGVANGIDDCPGTAANAQVNAAGCADADGDGVADTDDAFPNDPSESGDADGDGIGDVADRYPNAVTQNASGGIEVAIEPASALSSCSVTKVRSELTTAAGRPNAAYVSPSMVFFVLTNCALGESVRVTVEFADGVPRDSQAYKVNVVDKRWRLLPDAIVSRRNKTVSYVLADGSELDADGELNGVIVDPLALLGSAPPDSLAVPLPVPLSGFVVWLLMGLISLFGVLQLRRDAVVNKTENKV